MTVLVVISVSSIFVIGIVVSLAVLVRSRHKYKIENRQNYISNRHFVYTKNNLYERLNLVRFSSFAFHINDNNLSIIPKQVFYIWHDPILPPEMTNVVKRMIAQHPKLRFRLFDEQKCEEYLRKNMPICLHAFQRLIPTAYKADLARLCFLYVEGGIYLDIKFECMNGFNLNTLLYKKEFFVLDRPGFWEADKFGISNALIASVPKNEILLDAIHAIIKNVETKKYGLNFLYPTGPGLLGESYQKYRNPNNLEACYYSKMYYIIYRNTKILKIYPEYYQEQQEHGTKRYTHLYEQKKIYSV